MRPGFRVATAMPTDELETYLNQMSIDGWDLVQVLPAVKPDPHTPRSHVLVIHMAQQRTVKFADDEAFWEDVRQRADRIRSLEVTRWE